MSKLTKKEKEKLIQRDKKPALRGNTWIGIRPVVMNEGKYNKKSSRRESRKIIQETLDGMEESV